MNLLSRVDPPGQDETGLGHPPFPQANSVWVPHVRTSVRGLSKAGRSPIKDLSFSFRLSLMIGCPILRALGEGWDKQNMRGKGLGCRAVVSHPSPSARRMGHPIIGGNGWSVSSQRAACGSSERRISTGNPADRSGGIYSAPCGSLKYFLARVPDERNPQSTPYPQSDFAMPGRSTRSSKKINPTKIHQPANLDSSDPFAASAQGWTS
jgi:hypothetical protein